MCTDCVAVLRVGDQLAWKACRIWLSVISGKNIEQFTPPRGGQVRKAHLGYQKVPPHPPFESWLDQASNQSKTEVWKLTKP